MKLLFSGLSIEFAKIQQATIKFYYESHNFTKNIQKLPNIIKKIMEQKD